MPYFRKIMIASLCGVPPKLLMPKVFPFRSSTFFTFAAVTR